MAIFITQIILVLSLGAIVFITARALPRLPEEEKNEPGRPRSWTLAIEKKLPLERLDAGIHSLVEKVLRKTKLILMRVDNAVNRQLGRLKGALPAKTEEGISPSEHLDVLSEVKSNGNSGSLEGK